MKEILTIIAISIIVTFIYQAISRKHKTKLDRKIEDLKKEVDEREHKD